MITRAAGSIAILAVLALTACVRDSDDAMVASVQRLRSSVVLLSMKVPPENKKDHYDHSGGNFSQILSKPTVGRVHVHVNSLAVDFV